MFQQDNHLSRGADANLTRSYTIFAQKIVQKKPIQWTEFSRLSLGALRSALVHILVPHLLVLHRLH